MTESGKEDPGPIGSFLASLKSSGQAAFDELSQQLLENELFLAAMKRSLEAKGRVDKTIGETLDFMSLPSKNDVAKVLEEIQGIRARLVKQQRALRDLEQSVQELKQLLARRANE
jgi:hypothetical protein